MLEKEINQKSSNVVSHKGLNEFGNEEKEKKNINLVSF
jgi:hypothetical protein